MKKILLSMLIVISAIGLTMTVEPADTYAANVKIKEKKYKNCKTLNKDYKNGVSKVIGTKNKIVNKKTKKATYKHSNAHASKSLYKLNAHLDNDKDGIACEK